MNGSLQFPVRILVRFIVVVGLTLNFVAKAQQVDLPLKAEKPHEGWSWTDGLPNSVYGFSFGALKRDILLDGQYQSVVGPVDLSRKATNPPPKAENTRERWGWTDGLPNSIYSFSFGALKEVIVRDSSNEPLPEESDASGTARNLNPLTGQPFWIENGQVVW